MSISNIINAKFMNIIIKFDKIISLLCLSILFIYFIKKVNNIINA